MNFAINSRSTGIGVGNAAASTGAAHASQAGPSAARHTKLVKAAQEF